MSLPRYHQVEIPIPAPTLPIMVFSCQKQPASPITACLNRFDPTTRSMSAVLTPLQSALSNPDPGSAPVAS